jgi:hypothetical protein
VSSLDRLVGLGLLILMSSERCTLPLSLIRTHIPDKPWQLELKNVER